MELSELRINFTEMFELEQVKTKNKDYVLFAYTDNENKYSVCEKKQIKNLMFNCTENVYENGYYSTFENCVNYLISKKYEDIEQLIKTFKRNKLDKTLFLILRQDTKAKYLYLVNDISLLYLENEGEQQEIRDKILKVYDFTKESEVEELENRISEYKQKDIKEILNKYHD